jgi:hypothetical protein
LRLSAATSSNSSATPFEDNTHHPGARLLPG